MATKPAFPFAAKESKREEAAEKKMSKAAYAKGEKKESLHKKLAKGRKAC